MFHDFKELKQPKKKFIMELVQKDLRVGINYMELIGLHHLPEFNN